MPRSAPARTRSSPTTPTSPVRSFVMTIAHRRTRECLGAEHCDAARQCLDQTCSAGPQRRQSPRSRSSSLDVARSWPTRTSTPRSGAVGIALVFGLVIMVMVYATGHLSGAHINPAVTIAFTLSRHFPARDAAAYIAAQLAGRNRWSAAAARRLAGPARRARRHRPEHRGRQRLRLRTRADRVPDVRDHGRGHRHARRRRRRGDRDRRDGRPRRAVRRAGHRRVDEPGPLVRSRAGRRRVDRLLDLRARPDRRRRTRRVRLPAGAAAMS